MNLKKGFLGFLCVLLNIISFLGIYMLFIAFLSVPGILDKLKFLLMSFPQILIIIVFILISSAIKRKLKEMEKGIDQ